MPRKRASEDEKEWEKRLNAEARRVLDDGIAAEDALDEMVKRSIRRYGP